MGYLRFIRPNNRDPNLFRLLEKHGGVSEYTTGGILMYTDDLDPRF
jgi:hypothetical protein